MKNNLKSNKMHISMDVATWIVLFGFGMEAPYISCVTTVVPNSCLCPFQFLPSRIRASGFLIQISPKNIQSSPLTFRYLICKYLGNNCEMVQQKREIGIITITIIIMFHMHPLQRKLFFFPNLLVDCYPR